MVSSYSSLISGVDSSLGTIFGVITPYLSYIQYAFLGYYGAVIGLSVFALLGVIIMACFDKTGCRHLMYISCVIMLIACIVGFLLSFVLSIIIPFLYMGCTVITPALSSSTGFLNTTTSLGLPSSFSNITSLASVCLSGGGGQIMNQMGSTTSGINTQIGNVQSMMTNMNSYGSYNLTPINTAISNVTTIIDDYTYAAYNDLTSDATSLQWFMQIANQSYPSACTSNAVFLADSLVPSTNSLSLATIPCGGGTTVVTCTAFGAVSASCPAGCINMYTVMTTMANAAALTTAISARYGAACATALNTDFTINYNAWYTPRTSATTGIPSVLARWNAGAATDLSNVVSGMTSVMPNMTSTFSSLNTSMNKLIDPNYGMVAGVNCLLIGQDLQLTVNTVCVTLFNSLYFLFMTIGTASFALLFSMCCIVCSGVRHYKQSLKKTGKAIPDGSSLGLNGPSINQGYQAKGGYY
jgi:hypothetical protein